MSAEHAPLTALEQAYGAYVAAQAARAAAEAAEDDAEVKLEATLRAIESSAAGPSGAVKQE